VKIQPRGTTSPLLGKKNKLRLRRRRRERRSYVWMLAVSQVASAASSRQIICNAEAREVVGLYRASPSRQRREMQTEVVTPALSRGGERRRERQRAHTASDTVIRIRCGSRALRREKSDHAVSFFSPIPLPPCPAQFVTRRPRQTWPDTGRCLIRGFARS
jgi:hypothetical protein